MIARICYKRSEALREKILRICMCCCVFLGVGMAQSPQEPLDEATFELIKLYQQKGLASVQEKLETMGIHYDYLDKIMNEDMEVMNALKSHIKEPEVVEDKVEEGESEEEVKQEEEVKEEVVEKSKPVVKRLSKKAKKSAK